MSGELKWGIPKAIPIGKVEFTEEEKEENDREFEEYLKRIGVLEEDESIKDFKDL